jgi:hypothetical protein
MILGFRKENLTQNDVVNLVRNLKNKLPAGNIRKLLIELMQFFLIPPAST